MADGEAISAVQTTVLSLGYFCMSKEGDKANEERCQQELEGFRDAVKAGEFSRYICSDIEQMALTNRELKGRVIYEINCQAAHRIPVRVRTQSPEDQNKRNSDVFVAVTKKLGYSPKPPDSDWQKWSGFSNYGYASAQEFLESEYPTLRNATGRTGRTLFIVSQRASDKENEGDQVMMTYDTILP